MDPYKILGVSRGASMDEVKKAYRKKARENHPDLNPDDLGAQERMNQVNEAYDRIVNPEKYVASDARKYGWRGAGHAGGAGYPGAGTGAGYPGAGYPGGSSYPGGANNPGYGYDYGAPFAWTVIDFEDFFGNGWGAQRVQIHPEPAANDSAEIKQAINSINTNNFMDALNILQQIPVEVRGARWHYLFAIANNGAGNVVAAHDNINRARQMDPTNVEYQQAEAQFSRNAQAYTQQGHRRGFNYTGIDPAAICCCICLAPSICSCISRMAAFGDVGGRNFRF